MKLDIKKSECPRHSIADMFHAMARTCLNLEEATRNKVIKFSNPKWGYEIETKDRKYQLVLELKEVKK